MTVGVILSVYFSGLAIYATATVVPWAEARSRGYRYSSRAEALWSIAVLMSPVWFLAVPVYVGWCAILAYKGARSYFGKEGDDR